VLEAGCGLGQYVLLLREHGWRAFGADWSVEALVACRRVAPAPLAAMDLAALALRSSTVAAYVSLGVVEHDPDGPDRLLAEARRVLVPGGVAVVSVPYWNGARRLGTAWIRRRNRAIARAGGQFYQYAFSRDELVSALGRHGLETRALHPYDPARLLRGLTHRRGPRAPSHGAPDTGGAARVRGLRGAARRLLYSQPGLRLFGHMLLAVAVKG
jgi:SAM-dependent methyltransferase